MAFAETPTTLRRTLLPDARLGDVTLNPKGHYHKKFTHYASGLLSVLSILGRIGRARSLDLASADVLVPVDSLALPPPTPPRKVALLDNYTHDTEHAQCGNCQLGAGSRSSSQDRGGGMSGLGSDALPPHLPRNPNLVAAS